jgi:hypothetical protein
VPSRAKITASAICVRLKFGSKSCASTRKRRRSSSRAQCILLQKLSQARIYFILSWRNSICSHHGRKKAKTLLRGSQNKSHHKSTTERFVHK